ncbi:MAG: hypothetical protein IKJ63_00450 [Clostridia bacterium]|nr:hypothetical protein [Clostridia bacterium]
MKRIFISFLCCALLCLQIIPCVAAASGMQTEKNEDGSFFIISDKPLSSAVAPPDFENQIVPGAPTVSNMSAIIKLFRSIIEKLLHLFRQLQGKEEVTKTKYIYYYSSDSKLLWSGKLTGEFMYSSSSAQCLNASFDFETYDSNWKLDDYTCSTKNATASVTFSVVQKSLGVKLQTIEKTITLTCDTNGNVS